MPPHSTCLCLPSLLSPSLHSPLSPFTPLSLPSLLLSITLEQAKDVHRSLKLAAGMFLHVKDQLLPKLPASTEKGTDFDSRVVEAYANQSQAEAQEGKGVNREREMPLWKLLLFSSASHIGPGFGVGSQTKCGLFFVR